MNHSMEHQFHFQIRKCQLILWLSSLRNILVLFTEPEVFEALGKCGLDSEKSEVKRWYDGFIFGEYKDIYNPWSILNYLDSQQYTT